MDTWYGSPQGRQRAAVNRRSRARPQPQHRLGRQSSGVPHGRRGGRGPGRPEARRHPATARSEAGGPVRGRTSTADARPAADGHVRARPAFAVPIRTVARWGRDRVSTGASRRAPARRTGPLHPAGLGPPDRDTDRWSPAPAAAACCRRAGSPAARRSSSARSGARRVRVARPAHVLTVVADRPVPRPPAGYRARPVAGRPARSPRRPARSPVARPAAHRARTHPGASAISAGGSRSGVPRTASVRPSSCQRPGSARGTTPGTRRLGRPEPSGTAVRASAAGHVQLRRRPSGSRSRGEAAEATTNRRRRAADHLVRVESGARRRPQVRPVVLDRQLDQRPVRGVSSPGRPSAAARSAGRLGARAGACRRHQVDRPAARPAGGTPP